MTLLLTNPIYWIVLISLGVFAFYMDASTNGSRRVKKHRGKKMEVDLLQYTDNASKMCGVIARSCYSKSSVKNLMNSEEDYTDTLKDVVASGHLSVVEHATYTFVVSGVSRVLTHQLVRHRLASYTQQSARYVRMNSASYIVPPSIKENRRAYDIYIKQVDSGGKVYDSLCRLGIPQEDARYVLSNSIDTNITITMNARELLHFFSLRCCNRAQWEIREMANRMLEECKRVSPEIFDNAGPPCIRGECPEGDRSCRNEI